MSFLCFDAVNEFQSQLRHHCHHSCPQPIDTYGFHYRFNRNCATTATTGLKTTVTSLLFRLFQSQLRHHCHHRVPHRAQLVKRSHAPLCERRILRAWNTAFAVCPKLAKWHRRACQAMREAVLRNSTTAPLAHQYYPAPLCSQACYTTSIIVPLYRYFDFVIYQ